MNPDNSPNAKFVSSFFPQQIMLVSVGENILPMGYWTVISKDPFRFLICMQVGNHSLSLLRKYKEAALHFFPWSERERVVKAGYVSGRNVNKAQMLGFELITAQRLQHTRLVVGAECIFETVFNRELMNISREFAPCVMDVVATHGEIKPVERKPILYLSMEDFATTGETWTYDKQL